MINKNCFYKIFLLCKLNVVKKSEIIFHSVLMKNNVLFEIPNPEERKNVILQIIRIVFHLKFESQKMPNERK